MEVSCEKACLLVNKQPQTSWQCLQQNGAWGGGGGAGSSAAPTKCPLHPAVFSSGKYGCLKSSSHGKQHLKETKPGKGMLVSLEPQFNPERGKLGLRGKLWQQMHWVTGVWHQCNTFHAWTDNLKEGSLSVKTTADNRCTGSQVRSTSVTHFTREQTT